MARTFGKVLGLVVSIIIIAVFICAFGKEGYTGGVSRRTTLSTDAGKKKDFRRNRNALQIQT